MYKPDILGENFEQLTIQMKPDREGEVVCTLVRAKNQMSFNRSVLYIHGFSDYFFQTEMAEQFTKNGYNFYALDLRKCGRSIRAWQTPSNLYNISDYYEDIDAAIAKIRKISTNLLLLGHSTGGLTLALYVHNKPAETFEALILNSPFFEMNTKKYVKKIAIPLTSFFGKFLPNFKIKKGISPHYGHSISSKAKGEWDYNENWKPIAVSTINASWIRAIHKAQVKLRKGLNIKCPVLVMQSEKSFKSKQWSEEFRSADAVLNVEHIKKHSPCLGKNVTNISIKNGLHDLMLSAYSVRMDVYNVMFNWVNLIQK